MSSLRQALRQLTLHAGFGAVIIAMLALGIGGTTAIFALFYKVQLEPLPVREPQRLVNLRAPGEQPGYRRPSAAFDRADASFSYPLFRDLEQESDAFEGLAAHYEFLAQLTHELYTDGGRGVLVSGRYFDVLGLRPAIGRLIGPNDAPRVGEGDVVVLSHEYWQSRFGGDLSVLGGTLIVNNRALTIVGVTPEGFSGTTTGWRPEIFVPLTLRWVMQPEMPRNAEDRRAHWLYLFARLRPGVDVLQAGESVNRRYAAILADVEAPMLTGVSESERAQFASRRIVLEPGARGQNPLSAAAGGPTTLLLVAMLLVLLIVCINVANLLLARGAARSAEIAIRRAVGASRGRVAVQLLFESALLAAIGGLLAVPVAFASMGLIKTTLIPRAAAEQIELTISAPAIAFAFLATAVTALLFGLSPALRVSNTDPGRFIKTQAVAPAARRLLGRGGFVPMQIVFAVVLLVLAGLFTRSLINVARIDLGMDVDPVVVFSVSPLIAGYDGARVDALYDAITERLRAEPGVRAVSAAAIPLFSNLVLPATIAAGGADSIAEGPFTQGNPMAGPGLFETLSIPLVAGRDFSAADSRETPAVAIVNEAFVRAHGLGAAAVGSFVRVLGPFVNSTIEVVGVVRDARYSTVKGTVLPQLFTPRVPGDISFGTRFFYVRADGAPDGFLARIPRVMAEIDPSLPVTNLALLGQYGRDSVFGDRLLASLATAFAALATLLTAIGLYGVLSYNITRRQRELGLRIALGAEPGRLLTSVLRQVATMTLVGVAIGLASAVALGALAGRMLYGLSGVDPLVLTGAVVIISLVVLAASYAPARRAARVEPMQALRYE
jgi:predicted permease